MYLGQSEEEIPLWVDEYRPGIGTLSYRCGKTTRTNHDYRCDHCGREYHVLHKPTERFFCHCNRLVSIEPAR